MKKIILTLLVFISSINLYSQTQIDVPETSEIDVWIGSWLFTSKVTYTFNTECLATSGLLEINDLATNMLENSSLLTITYNTDNLFDVNTNALWNATTSTWEDNLKAEFFYDSNNNLTNTTNYDSISNDWVEKDRILQDYLASNLLLISTYQNWDGANWINKTKADYSYNLDNSLDIILNSVWDGSVWMQNTRETHIYSGNLLTQKEISEWDGSNYINKDLITFSYDANEFLINRLEQRWNGSVYENDLQIIRTNNIDGNPTESITQDFSFGSWMNTSRDTRTYPTCATLSTDDFTDESVITFYPNPASNSVFLKSKTEGQLSIVDMTGKKAKSYETQIFNEAIDVSQLERGIYVFIFQTETTKTTKRIIIN